MALNLEKVKIVYNAVIDQGFDLEPFDDWLESMVFFHETETGGLAVNRDMHEPSVWWVNLYAPKSGPSKECYKLIIMLCHLAGCKYLASKVFRPGTARIMQRLGFQNVGNDIYAIRCN